MHRLTALSLNHPVWIGLALLAATSFFAAGLARIETAVGYRAFLGEEHPALRALDRLADTFGAGYGMAAVWRCGPSEACDDVFDASSLLMAEVVADELRERAPFVRVDGPASSPLWSLDGSAPRLLYPPEATDRSAVASFRALALENRWWVGQIVSADASAGALLMQLRDATSRTSEDAVRFAREALAPFEAKGFEFALIGGPVEFVVAGRELADATGRMIPVMIALTGVVLILVAGRALPALLALVVIGIAVIATLGLLGWSNWPQNSLSQALPPLVLVIGVCDVIHLLTAYASELPENATREVRTESLVRAAARVSRACVLTSLTTAVGFASFSIGELESLGRFGWAAAWGVMVALVLTFSLLPMLVVYLPAHRARPPVANRRLVGSLRYLGNPSSRRAKGALIAAGILSAAAYFGWLRLEVEASFEDLYGEKSQVVRWVERARALRQPETLEIVLHVPAGTDASDDVVRAAIEEVEALAELDGLSRPLALGRALGADGRLLRELQRLAPTLVRLYYDGDRAFRVSLQADKLDQGALRSLLGEVETMLTENLAEYTPEVTGTLPTVAAMIDAIRATQLSSFTLALVVVVISIGVFFGSCRLALVSLVPTLLPVLWTLGAMGWFGVALDVGSAMVAAVILGLAVDDTIHVLSVVQREQARGATARRALATSIDEVGRALITTSVALIAGFGALALSPWNAVASFGAVAAVAIAAALAANLWLLPALLRAWEDRPFRGVRVSR
ncbi:MAG: MMPL family transporter [Myxococcales bacterium]|nr:MMPL family transporter [Myxococcales bacterium]